jgi:hypothetical protein
MLLLVLAMDGDVVEHKQRHLRIQYVARLERAFFLDCFPRTATDPAFLGRSRGGMYHWSAARQRSAMIEDYN